MKSLEGVMLKKDITPFSFLKRRTAFTVCALKHGECGLLWRSEVSERDQRKGRVDGVFESSFVRESTIRQGLVGVVVWPSQFLCDNSADRGIAEAPAFGFPHVLFGEGDPRRVSDHGFVVGGHHHHVGYVDGDPVAADDAALDSDCEAVGKSLTSGAGTVACAKNGFGNADRLAVDSRVGFHRVHGVAKLESVQRCDERPLFDWAL